MPRIAGLMLFHDDDRYGKVALDSLSEFCTEGIFINLNDATPHLKKVAENHPAVRGIIETTNNGGKWSQGQVRTDAIRMLDGVKPDIVLNNDSDETFPSGFRDILDGFIADDSKQVLMFRLLYLWDSPTSYRADWKPAAHCRGFKWREGLSYLPYGGYAMPTQLRFVPKKGKLFSPKPIVHWGYMKKDDRDRKLGRGNCSPKSDIGLELKEVPSGLIDQKYAPELV